MPAVTVEALLESGAHFGHLTRRWNPKMRNFIFTERNGIHIIDLRKTQLLVDIAREAANDVSRHGRGVLFVGTKNQAKGVVEELAKRCGSNYVGERWLGGMLTNFSTIRKSIKRLGLIDKMEIDGTFEKITKKERLMLTRCQSHICALTIVKLKGKDLCRTGGVQDTHPGPPGRI